jgi:membrane associated rhomboid family serine protease
MQTENSFIADLKNTYRTGGMTVKLIFINVMVFIVIGVLEVISKNLAGSVGQMVKIVTNSIFGLYTDVGEFIYRPWGLFTNIFAHYGFMHLFVNMFFLYVVGRIFEQFFSGKRLLYTYILGGVFGGLLEIIANLILPGFSGGIVIGASGSVMAILVATAFYQPQLTISVFGLFKMRLIYLALIFILTNLYNVGMGTEDGTAYFAHLGGALLGYLSVQNPFSSTNIINRGIALGDGLTGLFRRKQKKNGTFRYSKEKAANTRTYKSDEEYNMDAKRRQERIDAILDKISKSGYESLTKEEKDLLFSQSNK